MWRELAIRLCHDAVLGPPAADEALAVAEQQRLAGPLPPCLAEVLGECDGMQHEYGNNVIWSLEQLQVENQLLRENLRLAFLYRDQNDPLFIGDNSSDDRFALTPGGGERVFVWVAETGEWLLAAASRSTYA
jgi:hypothetical protein